MQMLYNSDSFCVTLFEVHDEEPRSPSVGASRLPPTHGAYEIVDKFSRRGVFIHGAMAHSFKQGVEALIATQPSEEDVDDYIERFSSLMQHPVVVH
jgi:hypothetical protein